MLFHALIGPVFDPRKAWRALAATPRFVVEYFRFRRAHRTAGEAMPLRLMPILHERTPATPFDPHYAYLGYWATKWVRAIAAPEGHVDVGGHVQWLMDLAAGSQVITIDIRPFHHDVPTLKVVEGSALRLPYPDRSVRSLSCLHVAEHIGLGRYGDPLDAHGCRKAMSELARVLAPGGRLLFAVPCGRPAVYFNAHRVLAPDAVIEAFAAEGLRLDALAGVTDDRRLHEPIDRALLARQDYGCGFFVFER
jgi:SAM-dependent methyltransferase